MDFIDMKTLSTVCLISKSCHQTASRALQVRRLKTMEQVDHKHQQILPHQQLFLVMSLATVTLLVDQDQEKLRAQSIQTQLEAIKTQKRQNHRDYVVRQCATKPNQ
jgi:hypothetical protein